ncbi:MAG: TadE/TadG family type IV pilus assembly protein [Caulobacteraceae bacterium]
MTRAWRWLAAEGGATAAEFAIILPAFLLVIFGSMEFGRYLWTANVLQQTAIQTARCMGVRQTQCASAGAYSGSNSLAYGQEVAAGYGLTLASANFTLSNSATCAGVSGFSQVTVNYTFTTLVPLIKALAGGMPIAANACFPNRS